MRWEKVGNPAKSWTPTYASGVDGTRSGQDLVEPLLVGPFRPTVSDREAFRIALARSIGDEPAAEYISNRMQKYRSPKKPPTKSTLEFIRDVLSLKPKPTFEPEQRLIKGDEIFKSRLSGTNRRRRTPGGS